MTLLCKVQVQVQAILQERMCCSAESVCGNFSIILRHIMAGQLTYSPFLGILRALA
ncbi:hypothetical protein DPMN_161575 [Dreissena polymorpha]|uniref:Uncharacterized protein n=1 Tax=Dreissena polymorpha TaxID=45954 RepID=A0A9D4ITI8_DREPO|nr:hypothetical protein DPMN_161575 [Dreissena polymorpha]